MVIAALPDAETAGIIATLLFAMCMIFNGFVTRYSHRHSALLTLTTSVLQPPDALPGFWLFMYRVSPFTYIIDGIVGTALHGRKVVCSEKEVSVFNPPAGTTCGEYMARYLALAPGTLSNPNATSRCEYCALTVADQYLAPRGIEWGLRWRNFGLIWAYIVFDIAMVLVLYYMIRVRRWGMGGGQGKKQRRIFQVCEGVRAVGKQARRLITGRKEKLPLFKRADNPKII